MATPTLWLVTLAGIAALFLLDFLITRRPHVVGTREAAGWSAFYVALPLLFGGWLWSSHGSETGLSYLTGYVVEKSLSIDNLFVFMLILSAFAVPKALLQRVLLIGVAGALVLRGVFIALGSVLLSKFAITFLIFGAILLVTAVKVWRDARSGTEGGHEVDPNGLLAVRLVRRLMPVTDDYRGDRMTVREGGRRMLTPLAVATVAILGVDVLFAVDSVPAVYGITDDAYLVFVTNAFALLGLRALYFLLANLLSKLSHLSYGMAAILLFIGVKLVLHWAHGVWPAVPGVPTLLSLGVILGILALTTVTSLLAARRGAAVAANGAHDEDATYELEGDRCAR